MESYEQLTGRMYRSFEELAGYSPDDASDLGIRMKVLAGEVYSALASLEYLKGQLSLSTASGAQLTALAAEYGLTRKPAQKAQGVLRFSIGEDGWYSITIPRGSVCTTADGAVNFVTTQEAVLAAGSRYVLVPAAAEQAGRAGNVRAGTVVVLVSQPVGIEQVTNLEAFSGGAEEESDEHLRGRLLKLLRDPPRSANAAFYRELCLADKAAFHLAGGLPEFLDALQEQQTPVAIATTAELANVRFYFEHFGLGRWFQPGRVVYQDGSFPGKPNPAIYRRAAAALDKRPEECLVFEDSGAGITAARQAGCGQTRRGSFCRFWR